MIINTKENMFYAINCKNILYVCTEPTNQSMGYYFDYLDKIDAVIEELHSVFDNQFEMEFGREIYKWKYNKDFPSVKLGTVWHYEDFENIEIGVEISTLCLSGYNGGINFDYIVRYFCQPLTNRQLYDNIDDIFDYLQQKQIVKDIKTFTKQIKRKILKIEKDIIQDILAIYREHTKQIVIDEKNETQKETRINKHADDFYDNLYKAYLKYFKQSDDIDTAYNLAVNYWHNIFPMSFEWHKNLFSIKKFQHLLNVCGDISNIIALQALKDAYNEYLYTETRG